MSFAPGIEMPAYNVGMGGRLGVVVLGAWALALSACAPAPPRALEPRPPGTGRAQVTVTGFESEKGQALIALFLDAKGWPADEKLAFRATVLPIRERQVVAEFEGVPAGPFAVSVFHDEDLDRKLDTGFLGVPSEDYGFSRDARNMFGPPSFDEARLDLAADEAKAIAIRVE